MRMPGVSALIEERCALVETMASLTTEQLESGPTLCHGWTPRDVLAHVMGVDTEFDAYVRHLGRVGRGNDAIVARYRRLPVEDLLARAGEWAPEPGPVSRAMALQLLGDNAIHHQDVLRPLGRMRIIPPASKAGMLREGVFLGARKLLHHRVVPTDGGRSFGRGLEVRGTTEALALWLAGRNGIEPELGFGPLAPVAA